MTSISRVVEIGTSSRWRTRGAGQARVLHDGDLAGELGEQPHRAVHHVVEVDRADQEPLDRPALGRRERLDPGQPVDEEPVAAVGGHPAGAGVRLPDVALLLQHGHVVADRGRRDAEVVPLDQGLAADRLLGGDVVLDDGAQHLELAVVEGHAHLPSRRTDTAGRRAAGWHSTVTSASLRRHAAGSAMIRASAARSHRSRSPGRSQGRIRPWCRWRDVDPSALP